MASQSYFMPNIAGSSTSNAVNPAPKNKLYYEEKAVGSTSFYKCEACPYMALAEDDIKFHLFTVHLDLAKSNGLADNIKIPCPGCTEVFDAENTLRTHLREHHKMGIRDVRKMVKSLIQIALKNNKKYVQEKAADVPILPTAAPEVKIPQVIEIVPDIIPSNNDALPSGVTVISVDELQKMSTPNFEQVDPKEIIQEASINIVYSAELPNDFVAKESSSNISVLNATPDIISSVQVSQTINIPSVDTNMPTSSCTVPREIESVNTIVSEPVNMCQKPELLKQKSGTKCNVGACGVRLVSDEKLSYHISCHQNGKLQCPECKRIYQYVKELHTHLWKEHDIDMELNSCDVCEYKTYSMSRLNKIHKKIHQKERNVACPICGKMFKNYHQMYTHRVTHKTDVNKTCSICVKSFVSAKQLKRHVEAVHENKKPFQCGECDFATNRKCSLKLHIRNHTAEEIYKCDQCDFSTIDHNSMRRHKLQHSNQKKYSCKHCSYTSIQSRCFLNHMAKQHSDIQSDDIFPCPYCKFKSVNRGNLLTHLIKHKTGTEDQNFVIDLNSEPKTNWNTPSEDQPKSWNTPTENEPMPSWSSENQQISNWNTPIENEPITTWSTPDENTQSLKTDSSLDQQLVNNSTSEIPPDVSVPIEVDDCDSEQDLSNYPVNYSFVNNAAMSNDKAYHVQEILTDLTKDDNNSDCIISESSNDTVNERHPCFSQHMDKVNYGNDLHGTNLIDLIGTAVTMGDNLLQNNNINVNTSNSFGNNNISTSIMSNFPIYLPPRISIRQNLTLTPSDKIPLPVPKVMGPIIKPTQILPVPSSSNSPVLNTSHRLTPTENDGIPKKKAKISVKSNLILKGPDQINMFNSDQNMVFGRLQDNERLSSPVTFNNLITCMQIPPEPAVINNSEDGLGALPPYTPEPMLGDPAIAQVKDNRLFTFNRQIALNSINMLSQDAQQTYNKMSIICGNPNFIKLESKQNIQSPSLERMCNMEMMKTQEISDVYCKSSPRLEDMQKNVNEIKNEIKSDTFFNMSMGSTQSSPSVIDRHLMDTIIGANEMYSAHLDLSGVVLPEMSDEEQQPDIIEIDDNSEDNKLLPHGYNMNYPLEYIHNDFYFLESELNQPCSIGKAMPSESMSELNKMATDVPPIINPSKDSTNYSEIQNSDYDNFIHGRKDPMMNTSVRPAANKINVKNIELMKN